MLQTTKFKQAFHCPYKDSKSLKKQAKQKKKTSFNWKKGGRFIGMEKMKHFKILFIKIYCNW